MSLSHEESLLVEELRINGPLLEAQIPTQITNTIGFSTSTLNALIDQGLAVRITVKGNRGFVALRAEAAEG